MDIDQVDMVLWGCMAILLACAVQFAGGVPRNPETGKIVRNKFVRAIAKFSGVAGALMVLTSVFFEADYSAGEWPSEVWGTTGLMGLGIWWFLSSHRTSEPQPSNPKAE